MEVVLYRTSATGTGQIRKERLELGADRAPITVRQVLTRLGQRYALSPGDWLEEGAGCLRSGITVAVNRWDIERLSGLETLVGAQDEMAIIGDLPFLVEWAAGERSPGAQRQVVLRFHGPLANRWGLKAGARHEVAVASGCSLRAVLEAFSASFGVSLADWLLDPESADLRPLVRVAVNDRLVEGVQGLDTALAPGDQVVVMEFLAALSGG